jgi:hypothetical protein
MYLTAIETGNSMITLSRPKIILKSGVPVLIARRDRRRRPLEAVVCEWSDKAGKWICEYPHAFSDGVHMVRGEFSTEQLTIKS